MNKTGKVVRWDEARGFGFIRSGDTDADVFFHIRDVRGLVPAVGLWVTYEEIHVGGKGPRAMAVRPVAAPAAVRKGAETPRHPMRGRSAAGGPAPADRWLLPVMLLALAWASLLGWGVSIGRLPGWVMPAWVGVNLVAFFAYWQDKWAATRGAWRTREDTLHLWSLLGGWGGARLAQQLLRHKSRKASFQSSYWGSVVMHVGLVSGWLAWPYFPH